MKTQSSVHSPYYFYGAVALLSGLVMAMQIMHSRIFSVTSWYHLSFLVISVAMFGMTVGALTVYKGNEEEQRKNYSLLSLEAIMYCGISLVFSLIVQLSVPVVSLDIITLMFLPLVTAVTALPYYFAGVAITLALTRSPYAVGKVYGADLLGAALGCLAALFLMSVIDTPSGVLLLCTLLAVAGWLFIWGQGASEKTTVLKKLLLWIGLSAFGIASLNILMPKPFIYPFVVKGYKQSIQLFDYEDWNSISRITVTKEKKDVFPFLWGPSVTIPESTKTSFKYLTIDGDAGTPIPHFDGKSWEDHSYLEYDVTNLAYQLPDIKDVAIIGVGGGRDLMSAKYFGAKNVVAMDVNGIQIHLLKGHPDFKTYSNLSALPGVEIIHSEARSWFRENDKKFDLVEMSLIDTWASTGAGAFALSENGLYTVEAWKTFMHDLSDDGVFTVSRWYDESVVNELARLVSLAMSTLFSQGIENPRAHIFVAGSGNIATLVLSKSPFTDQQLDALSRHTEKMQFKVLLSPRMKSQGRVIDILSGKKSDKELKEYTDTLWFDFSPPTDMRPFFFNQVRFSDPVGIVKLVFTKDMGAFPGHARATLNLFLIILFSLFMVGFVILYPMVKSIKGMSRSFVLSGTAYFFLIGLGFMFVEIALLQALGVFLGHPSYGLGIVLFSLIFSTGAGSFLSEKLPLNKLWQAWLWCVLACAYVMALAFYIQDIFTAFSSTSLVQRALISVMVIFPCGLLLGYGFPTGIRYAHAEHSRATSWFWGVNGATGVLGSALAMAFSIRLGIDTTLMIGGICYGLLALVLPRLSSSSLKQMPST